MITRRIIIRITIIIISLIRGFRKKEGGITKNSEERRRTNK